MKVTGNMITLIGSLAAILTTAAGLPQLFKIIKTKQTKDLSLMMVLMFVVGIALWLVYGILIEDANLIFANIIAIIIQGTILIYKIKHK